MFVIPGRVSRGTIYEGPNSTRSNNTQFDFFNENDDNEEDKNDNHQDGLYEEYVT